MSVISVEEGRHASLGLEDLDEGVLVDDSLLADLAEVEVFANRALVTDSDDRTDTTTVASHVAMCLQLDLRAVRTCLLGILG